MGKIKQWFCGQKMSWLKVILLAVGSAVYTAVMLLLPPLKDTSFQDIGVYLECWILLALFIIVNCKKWWEAMLKCFMFFLISQPLIYLLQVPFYIDGFGIFRFYKSWFNMTLLTLPGAVIAYQVKRKDWLSVLVLSVANGYLAYQAVTYLRMTIGNFPHHLLSFLFCIALIVFFTFLLLDKGSHRVTALVLAAGIFAGTVCICGIGLKKETEEITLPTGEWTVTIDDETVASVEITGETTADITAKKNGDTFLTFEAADGQSVEYYVTVNNGNLFLDEMDAE
ncbi:MAG: hypothetical protein MJ062_04810 [Oscillospiraceae bacterium]|nr:hypothetical protein [Oscillospiraceae bacterium]